MPATTFARPAEIPPALLALAESMWDAPPLSSALRQVVAVDDDRDDLIAAVLGLDPGPGHDELTRCSADGCGAWFWADEGATVLYESGRDLPMCDVHAVPDDPGARVYPGVGLEAAWRDRDMGRAW